MSITFDMKDAVIQWKEFQQGAEIRFLPYDQNEEINYFPNLHHIPKLESKYYFECKPYNQCYKPGECGFCDFFYEDLYLKEIEESFLAT